MKYVEGSMKPGKPYRQRRMTAANCAVTINRQAELYLEHMFRTGQTVVHLYPASHPLSHRQQCRDNFTLGGNPVNGVAIIDVDPEEWK